MTCSYRSKNPPSTGNRSTSASLPMTWRASRMFRPDRRMEISELERHEPHHPEVDRVDPVLVRQRARWSPTPRITAPRASSAIPTRIITMTRTNIAIAGEPRSCGTTAITSDRSTTPPSPTEPAITIEQRAGVVRTTRRSPARAAAEHRLADPHRLSGADRATAPARRATSRSYEHDHQHQGRQDQRRGVLVHVGLEDHRVHRDHQRPRSPRRGSALRPPTGSRAAPPSSGRRTAGRSPEQHRDQVHRRGQQEDPQAGAVQRVGRDAGGSGPRSAPRSGRAGARPRGSRTSRWRRAPPAGKRRPRAAARRSSCRWR